MLQFTQKHHIQLTFAAALITISTRASLKRYHDYQLTLGLGEDASGYELIRIGTKDEKAGVHKELEELRATLKQAEALRQRRSEIEDELNKVWTTNGSQTEDLSGELESPEYQDDAVGMAHAKCGS